MEVHYHAGDWPSNRLGFDSYLEACRFLVVNKLFQSAEGGSPGQYLNIYSDQVLCSTVPIGALIIY